MEAFEILLRAIEECKYTLGEKVPFSRLQGMSVGGWGDQSLLCPMLALYSPACSVKQNLCWD